LQGSINWPSVSRSGITFAFAKATDGYSVDNTFRTNFNGALNAGLQVGAFHASDASLSSAASQSDCGVEIGVKYVVGDGKLIGALVMGYRPGVQYCYGLSQQQMIVWVNNFITAYQQSMNYSPIIYTRYRLYEIIENLHMY